MRFAKTPLLLVFVMAALVSCAYGQPLHIYLTYSDAPETSIDINVVMPEHVDGVNIYYDTAARDGKPGSYSQQVEAQYVPTLMELSDRRSLYVARLTDLEPGTVYYFVADEEEGGTTSERKFRTLPGGDAPVRFVNGGDMGVDGYARPLLELAGETDPDFAVIGGDLAYANGLLGAFAIWHQWLKNWEELMVTSDGRMIPIVAGIGNHETNRYAGDNEEARAPWYMGLFGRQGENVYYTRLIGNNAVFFVLDSSHLVPHAEQADWLRQQFEANKDVKYSFAVYHVPLYPAHRDYDGGGSVAGREHWLPVFDQYELTVGLEHHDHVFKRTKPLRNNEVVEDGTVYIGDGCFGRDPRTIDPQVRWYNEIEKSVAHFWVVDVAPDGLRFEAIDHTGNTIDQFELK